MMEMLEMKKKTIEDSSNRAKKRRNGDSAEVKIIFDDADKNKRSKSIRFNDDDEEDEFEEYDL